MPAPLKRLVLTPVLVSAAVFATLTLPLAFFGLKPITIQLQEEPIFSGQLRDIAAPYLGLTSVLSLGAGFASMAISGWRSSTHKSSQVEAQLSHLAQNLREKEAQLEALKLSESQLEAAGLSAFLDEPQQEPTKSPVVEALPPVEAPPQVEALVITESFAAPLIVPSAQLSRTVQGVSGLFANAQPFLGYARTRAKIVSQPAPIVTQLAPLDVSLDVRELHTKLEQIRAQMATLQNAIASTSPASSIETQPSQQTLDETTTAASHLQVVNWSVNQKSS
jgi:hypothetical protein